MDLKTWISQASDLQREPLKLAPLGIVGEYFAHQLNAKEFSRVHSPGFRDPLAKTDSWSVRAVILGVRDAAGERVFKYGDAAVLEKAPGDVVKVLSDAVLALSTPLQEEAEKNSAGGPVGD